MLNLEEKKQFSDILEELGNVLDITEKQHAEVVNRYQGVGNWLAQSDSSLSAYKPEIIPQGSFLLGTSIKPVHEDDELDVDLVCRLEGKQADWCQYDLKQKIGQRLVDSGKYGNMLDEEGRRCWTLKYAEGTKFHMDILPALVAHDYDIILERALKLSDSKTLDQLSIRITDKEMANYKTAVNPEYWPKSNPFGYAKWFTEQASLNNKRMIMLSESVKPIPKYTREKLPLQRIVQILKRHRDIMFEGNADKPVSCIITTLAARAYQKEENIIDGLLNVIDCMPLFIEERIVPNTSMKTIWISNPINQEENFADKWPANPQKQTNFYNWLRQLKKDILFTVEQRGLTNIQNSLGNAFGKSIINETFKSYGNKSLLLREGGKQFMTPNSGILSTTASRIKVPNHNFYGKKPQ